MKLGGVYDPAQSMSGGIMPNTAVLPYAALIVLAGLWGPAAPGQVLTGADALGDFAKDSPGLRRHIVPADLPAPYATKSVPNMSSLVDQPDGAVPRVPAGFKVEPFAQLKRARVIRVAPNGDIFVAQTRSDQVSVLRAADGASKPSATEIFAAHLNGLFGIAFYPAGANPQYVYIANEDSVVRFPYKSGDLKASGPAEVIVPKLPAGGGHTTRDIAFSSDGTHLYISVGSASNVDAEQADAKDIQVAEQERGLGASWGNEAWRADVLVTSPDGKAGLKSFANGIRNCAGLTVQPKTGDVWCATNERDALGDNLPPDYATRVKQGAFYGWPWYYIGGHEDPRRKGERPDLADKVTTPDVLIQPHSAPLQISFYTGSQFPSEYRDSAFVTLHGSWNRASRTGYKVVRAILKDGQPTGEYEDFLTGLVTGDGAVWGRPVGVATAHDGALLIGEDGNGMIWRVTYPGGAAAQ
jgi:glucose/arabinose dehydrogenase